MEKVLPKNWVYVSLQDVTRNIKGKKPKIQSELEFKGSIPYMDIKALEFNKIRQFADIESSKLFEEGDVAMVWDGARSGWVSKTNFGAIGSTLVAFKPIKINSNYLFYYLLEKYPYINSNARGVGIPHVDPTLLWSLKFPLPPLSEQNRIVEKLDRLFGQLEVIKSSMKKIPVLLKNFRQQVLTQAVTGKLTEEWREGKELESAEKLIQKIIDKRIKDYQLKCSLAKEKGERKPTKIYLDKFPEIESVNIDLPENWFQTNVHFLSFVTKLAGFEYSDHFDLKENGDIPVVRAQNVQMGRFEDKNRLYMSTETSDYLVRSQLHGREILMVFIGAGTGNVCLAPKNERWHLAPNVAKIDVDGISTEYLYLYLQSALGVENVLSRVKATAQPSLSMETIREIIAFVPPLKEQQEIVSRVESLFAKADAIEDKYKRLKAKIETLPQTILHKAFKGELSEQLETDGDARDLLEEIAALKNGGKAKKVVSKKYVQPDDEVLRIVAEADATE